MKRADLQKRDREIENIEKSLIELERMRKIGLVQTIVICVAVAILFIISISSAYAQSSHKPILDNPKVKYYDLKGRSVQPGLFKEKTLGWSRWFIMERQTNNGVIRKKVWISTMK